MQNNSDIDDPFEIEDDSPDSAAETAAPGHHEFVVGDDEQGQRLDRFIAIQVPEISRTHVQDLIDQGRVFVGGVAKKPSHRLELGEAVHIEIPVPHQPGVAPENIPLDILYEDKDIVVVNKPAGMIVHPGAGEDNGTLVAALLHRYGVDGLSQLGGAIRPGIVHRLDKDTSGVMLVARTNEAHEKLVDEFRERRVEKTYVALLHGVIKGEKGKIELPVSRDMKRRSRMTARRSDGREARTDWRLRLRLDPYSLVEASIHTGRTHQIRVHFSALSLPVIGDTVYGAPRQERIGRVLMPPLERNFLHSARIAFTHPLSGKPMNFQAPLAAELASYFQELGKRLNATPGAVDAALKEYS
jgi:23S rRNA pseudouridine1911/1915/1917 synthase